MGVVEAELDRLLVHQAKEGALAAGGGDRELERIVVAGEEQEAVHQLPDRHSLSRAEAFAVERDARDERVDADDLVRRQVLQGEEAGHDLRRRGDRPALVSPLRPEDRARVRVNQDRRARRDRTETGMLESGRGRQQQAGACRKWRARGDLLLGGDGAQPFQSSCRNRLRRQHCGRLLVVRRPVRERPVMGGRKRPSGDERRDRKQHQRPLRSRTAPALDGLQNGIRHRLEGSGGEFSA